MSKVRTKNWIEINPYSGGVCNTNSDIRFKTTMLKSSLCDYNDACIFVEGRTTVTGAVDDAAVRQTNERNKGVIFKNCAPFTSCKSEINNTEINNAKDIDLVMSVHNLIEYSNNYRKTSGHLWQYYKDEANDTLTHSE